MRPLGEIVRLQVQQSSLKVGERPLRRYDPTPLLAVAALTLDEGGVTGWTADGERVADVHHRDHPASKHRDGTNGVSVGFTGHYAALRDRFGAHLTDGLAGENILVASDRRWLVDDLAEGLVIAAGGARLRLERVIVAEPCVEFTRYALRYPASARTDRAVTEGLIFLGAGLRGYYAAYHGAPARIAVGDRVYLP
ncbi:MAG TPA: hypothetical protein VFW96_17680 [Thermomicrobiales bacterium]|nr:hypothetical protein [Thermomicrobiales bacterium]